MKIFIIRLVDDDIMICLHLLKYRAPAFELGLYYQIL